MKKFLKITAFTSMAGMLALSACATASAQPDENGAEADIAAESAVMSKSAAEIVTPAEIPEFMSFSGTVSMIQPVYKFPAEGETPVEGEYLVLVEGEEDEEGNTPSVNFTINQSTLMLIDGEIETGMEVTGFYDTGLPVTMIYPPQHQATVLAPGTYGTAVSRFDETFLSADGTMRISIGENTEITFQDGAAFEGDESELIGRALVVSYDLVNDSFPAQTVPSQIVILFERAVHPVHFLTEEELAAIGGETGGDVDGIDGASLPSQGGLQLSPEDLDMFWNNLINPETVQIVVDETVIDAPAPFVNREAGFVMVPVAPIAEALGYAITGEGEGIVIGRGTSTFTAGKDSYHFNRMAPVELGVAPEIRDGVLFVPLHFFGQVFPGGAYVLEGNVIVTSEVDTDVETE